MYEKSIEAIWHKYEKVLDRIAAKRKSVEDLDAHFYEAKQKYEDARAKLLQDVDQLEAESLEFKKAMDVLGGKDGS